MCSKRNDFCEHLSYLTWHLTPLIQYLYTSLALETGFFHANQSKKSSPGLDSRATGDWVEFNGRKTLNRTILLPTG